MIEKLKDDGSDSFRYYDEESGCNYESKKSFIQTKYLGFCGCGDPNATMKYVYDFLVRIKNSDFGEYEDMPYMFLCYWADNKGFVEHGVSVRVPFLTPLGTELMRDIAWCLENEKDVD